MALYGPGRYYLTVDRVNYNNGHPMQGWAAVRSADVPYAYGEIAAKSKIRMAIAMGSCADVLIEVERRHLTLLQCPNKVREGMFMTNKL